MGNKLWVAGFDHVVIKAIVPVEVEVSFSGNPPWQLGIPQPLSYQSPIQNVDSRINQDTRCLLLRYTSSSMSLMHGIFALRLRLSIL
jgi:hypothetical protein